MKILDLLAKLGILRFGTKKAVWHSAEDMPAEILMDGVFDAERDLTSKERLTATPWSAPPRDPSQLFCPQCGKPVGAAHEFCAACGAPLGA